MEINKISPICLYKAVRCGVNEWVEGLLEDDTSGEDTIWYINTCDRRVEVKETSICGCTGAKIDGKYIFDKDLVGIYDPTSHNLVALMEVYKVKVASMYFFRYISGSVESVNKKLGVHLIDDLEVNDFFKWVNEENKAKICIKHLGSVINPSMYRY